MCVVTIMQQVFRVKNVMGRRWGAPNSNYLLAMVSRFVMPFSIPPSPKMTAGFPAVSSRKRSAQALRWLSITKKCSGILYTSLV